MTTKEQQEELNELDKKNTKESFKNSHLMNLCSTKNGDPRKADDLQKRCKHLNKSQCALADCCSYVKFKNETEEQCVASRKGEPIFRKSKQNNFLTEISNNKTISTVLIFNSFLILTSSLR